jgi:two-component system, NarL family, sensor histidine kinase UhpB
MFKVIITFIIVTATVMPLTAGSPDSLLLLKAASAFELASVNSDTAVTLAREALTESQRNGFKRGEANAFSAMGWVYFHKGKLDSSVVWLNRAKALFAEESSMIDLVRININLTEVLTRQSRFGEALVLALQADSMAGLLADLPLQTDSKRLLGILYRESGDFDRSVRYFNEAVHGFEQQGDIRRLVNTSISLSILLRRLGRHDSSMEVLNRCLELTSGQPGNDYQIAMIREHLGETYYMKEQYRESLAEYTMAYHLFEKLGNMGDVAYEAIVVGRTHAALGQLAEAEYFLNRSYLISDSLGFLSYRYDASSELASLYSKMGDWEKAYGQMANAIKLKDSLDQQKQLQQLAELRERYESEKQEQEIVLLRAAVAAESLLNRRRVQVQYVTFALFLAVLGIAYLILNRFKLRQKLQEETLRNQISGDLHDDIGSTLSSIDINSRIALVKIDNPGLVASQLEKIQQNTRAIMDSMAHIVWSIHPDNDSLEKVVYRMTDFAAEILEPLGIRFILQQNYTRPDIKINPLVRKNVYMIFKEGINNCAKYSGAGEVTCTVDIRKNMLEFRISDNGSGFDADLAADTGNGLKNMQSRAAQMHGTLILTTAPGQGTTILLRVPVT